MRGGNWMIFLGVLVLLAGCAGGEPPAESPLHYTENARRAYEEALEDYFSHDWESMISRMQDVKRKYAQSRYARLAELRIADARFAQEQFPESITDYRTFIHDYPNDPEVSYARYKIAKAQFQSVSDTVLLPPLEERDLTSVHDAIATIRGLLNDYPTTRYREELEYMQDVVTGLLARHELYVARYYLAEDRYDAALARVEHALRDIADPVMEAEALVLLGETYLKLKKRREARAAFEQVLQEHPESAFSLPARRFLRHMGAPVVSGASPG
ncbi:MAG TPA: outer membrane protein assembly factor BamD, partial [Polyangiaceae bacterium]